MKSPIKTALTLALLIPLAGCWNSCQQKKEHTAHEATQAAGHTNEHKNSNKCSHKGCTHDHSKDAANKHHDEVKTQNIDDYMDDIDEENDVLTQNLDMDQDMDDSDEE